MGFFSSLDSENYDRRYSDRELVSRSLAHFAPYKKQMLNLAGLTLASSGIGALLPVLVSQGVGLIAQKPSLGSSLMLSAGVLVLGLASWAVNWASRRLSARAVSGVQIDLATEAYNSAMSQDLSFLDEYASGRVMSRITSDTQDFGQLITLVTDVIAQFVEALILAVVLLVIDWHLSLILFAVVPVIFLLISGYRKIARRVTREGMRAIANVNGTIKETMSAMSTAKSFRQEPRIYGAFREANELSYHINFRRGLTISAIFPAMDTLAGLTTAMMIYAGGSSVATQAVTVSAWYLFILSLDRFLYPMLNLSTFWTQVQNGLSAAERIFALIEAEPKVQQTGADKLDAPRGEVQFRHVDFAYHPEEPILQNFSLHIRPGETLALVGHTGAGKTSIARLITRSYEFQNGQIAIDGHDIRSLDLDDYRHHLGVVSQTPFLFSGTVSENIRYARPDASDQEIARLAHRIGDGEWLESLPNGLATEVGERGSFLSTGQRQLVALMRVLIQHPALFVLDEATANIDPFTEWQIQQALRLIFNEATSVLIAHRLFTVQAADRILVIEKGCIVEEGDHEGLMRSGGYYARLYETYFRHQSLTYIEEAAKLRSQDALS